MKKLIAALLVMTMVLALAGSAMAEHICVGDFVKFTKNGYAYSEPKAYKKVSDPEVIVTKGSVAYVIAKKGDYVFLQLTPGYLTEDLGNTYEVATGLWAWGYWFKKSVLDTVKKDYHKEIKVVFGNGGNGKSKVLGKNIPDAGLTQLTDSCKKHVKATAKVWMHYNPSLSSSYGRALHKDDKVTYRRVYGMDTRGQLFWGIKYKGKCLYVSGAYSKVVK
jgi:hypothetical protein